MRSRNDYPERMIGQHFTMMLTVRFIRFGKTLMRFMVLRGSPQSSPSATAFYDDVDRKIHQIWKDSDEVYGAPRITAELAERYYISLNRKTVAKRMRMMGIEGISPRAFVPVTTIQSKRKSTLPV
ncbi:IS3 family transposase [Corynebacterium striatum]|uniref:IS3 family transposase n=1 Tax=Corynebacterium striatum TaxID=43770 RepID=UPI000D76AD5A|nr:IS3 family transposase [Corynebacterium striatum]PXY14754.1 hypothetical protein CKF74_02570 [Corynebacterium striatum]